MGHGEKYKTTIFKPLGVLGGLWGALGVVLAWVLGFFGVIYGKAKRLFSEAKR